MIEIHLMFYPSNNVARCEVQAVPRVGEKVHHNAMNFRVVEVQHRVVEGIVTGTEIYVKLEKWV